MRREERERGGRGKYWNHVIYHEYKIGVDTCIYLVSRSYHYCQSN